MEGKSQPELPGKDPGEVPLKMGQGKSQPVHWGRDPQGGWRDVSGMSQNRLTLRS